MIIFGLSAEKAFEPFKNVTLKPFRDASYNNSCSYKCTVPNLLSQLLDCLRGIDYALKLKWFDNKKFNLNEY
jgi:cell division cycle 14